MISRTATIKNKTGLHARPALSFVKLSNSFPCQVSIVKDNKTVNGKSIVNVLSAAIRCGDDIRIITDGEREEEALAMLIDAVEAGLGEDD